ncbi:hypothetical protein DFR51_3624 [Sphingosinicella microcystinivorans]|uniref:Uncharacterized protein n=2 Tax=Sphingosinicella microcystinivorans TaxID=335406 RepID=A0ABX9SUQ1_SPHMI|nr:hypothetical protein DFR51_3624 [Sphingosinicella microcystinivorans]
MPASGVFWRRAFIRRCLLKTRVNAGKMLDKGLNPSAYKKLTSGIASLEGGDSFKAAANEWFAKNRGGRTRGDHGEAAPAPSFSHYELNAGLLGPAFLCPGRRLRAALTEPALWLCVP